MDFQVSQLGEKFFESKEIGEKVFKSKQIGEKVFKSKQKTLRHTDTRHLSSGDVCNPKMDKSYPGLVLQEGEPEQKLRKLEQSATFLVKGRRHILSMLKPVEERVKVDVEEPFKLERNVFSANEPSSWGISRNCQVPPTQYHMAGKAFETTNPKAQGTTGHLERVWLKKPGRMLLFPCSRKAGKGQSSRERGMSRAAMDERNMRERFWRLRERAFLIKLNDLLPVDKKSEKVDHQHIGDKYLFVGHSGVFGGRLERSTPVQF